MVFLRKLSITTAGAAAILSALSVPVSAFTITQSTTEDLFAPLGNLPAGAFGSVWSQLSIGYLAPPAAGSALFTHFIAEAPAQFPNWTVVSGLSLGGNLTIEKNHPRDYAAEPEPGRTTPRGGLDMIATYAKASTDPAIANLRFIQLFSDNRGPNGTSQIDRIERSINDMLPWYYTDAQHAFRSTETTMTIVDSPSDFVESIPFYRTVSFQTYLATFDNTTKVATIHDGWSWGYDINVQTEAVPEPLTILGSATALGFGAFFKREVSRKSKKN